MAHGISLHIGLNHIDPDHYGTEGILAGAENDAVAMRHLADSLGYRTALLLTESARSSAIISAIRDAASRLGAGDTFLITYAGHGAQIPDKDGDEKDKQDETWCVFDRMILDDELHALWTSFRSGVVVIAVSDSCHSGTVHRLLSGSAAVYRMLPPLFATQVAYGKNRDMYDSAKDAAKRGSVASPLLAGVIAIAAAQDGQLAADGARNGLFTEKLLEAWDQGRFEGSFPALIDRVKRLMAQTGQTPGCTFSGTYTDFESRRPFAIDRPANPETDSAGSGEAATKKCSSPTKEAIMQNTESNAVIENGNWEEVAAALAKQVPVSRGGETFMSAVIAANAKAAQEAMSKLGIKAVPEAAGNRGGSVLRAFWWGFHIQVSPEDLSAILKFTDPNGEVVQFLYRVIPKEYQYWIAMIAPFITVTSTVLRGLDRGRGIYISMSWFAPGIFVPTTV